VYIELDPIFKLGPKIVEFEKSSVKISKVVQELKNERIGRKPEPK
jgi:hypothetical protein